MNGTVSVATRSDRADASAVSRAYRIRSALWAPAAPCRRSSFCSWTSRRGRPSAGGGIPRGTPPAARCLRDACTFQHGGQAAGRARALTRRPVLTAGSVDGVPEVGVLPLAQLVFAVGRFAGLNLRTSDDGDTEKTQKGRGKSALKKRRNPCPASIPEPRRGGGGRRPQKRRAHMSLAVWATPPTRKRRRMID